MRHNASTEFVFHLLSGTNSERCKKRADTAECFGRAKVLGYTFDPEKKRCERLFHGGCDWLANLYTERKDCEGECKDYIKYPCKQPILRGHACSDRQSKIVYGFNVTSGKCEKFQYSGCGGNGNNFNQKIECWEVCQEEVRNKCNFPIDEGSPCGQATSQTCYGYNQQTRRCERFHYKGCFGFPNRFATRQECWSQCGVHRGSKCLMGRRTQKKGYLFPEHFYDFASDVCRPFSFIYGRISDPNRFMTYEDCQHQCRADFKGYTKHYDP